MLSGRPPALDRTGSRIGSYRICNFAVGQCFLAAVGAFGAGSIYAFFAAVCAAAVAFVAAAVPETLTPKGLAPAAASGADAV